MYSLRVGVPGQPGWEEQTFCDKEVQKICRKIGMSPAEVRSLYKHESVTRSVGGGRVARVTRLS